MSGYIQSVDILDELLYDENEFIMNYFLLNLEWKGNILL